MNQLNGQAESSVVILARSIFSISKTQVSLREFTWLLVNTHSLFTLN